MNINHLIEFVYLAEKLSFRQTADYFYVSRSVISRHVAALEEVLGTKLVERGNQSVRLTEAGKVFYREAQNVLRAYANAVDRTREVGRSFGRAVRVGYLKNAARPILVHFARFMGHEHPETRLDLTSMEYADLRRALEEGSVDVALGVNVHPDISRNYRSTPIYSDRFYALVGKDHPLAGKSAEGVAFSDLPHEKLLLPDSFVFYGMSELIDGLAQSESQGMARDYYRDVDILYLKVQTEGYVAFSSGLNNAMFGDRLAIVPITGIDTSFTVSAFYGEAFGGSAYEACRKGFESCQAALKNWSPAKDLDAIGFAISDLA